MSFFSGIAKFAKSVIKSPVVKAVAGGAAIVFPPVGVPAVAAIATANTALALAESGPAKAALGAAAKLGAKTKLVNRARRQIKAGVPKAKAKAQMIRSAHAIARKVRATKPAAKMANKHRTELAAQLKRTKSLAAKGDPGAKRALATFKVVAAARKGNPKARAAVALIAHRYEIGQRVRSRYELTTNGRIRARA
jgi:hypothetical protein